MLSGLAHCCGWFPHSTFWARLSFLWADPTITWGRARPCPVKCTLFAPNMSPDRENGCCRRRPTERGFCLGCVTRLSPWAGAAVARQPVPLCSCSRHTSAGAAEVIHHPRSLLPTLLTAGLFWVFSPFEVLSTLVLLEVSG